MNLPILYQKTNTGAIQSWLIEVHHEVGCSLIVTTHGQVGGKLQTTSDTITKGKNEGRANATSYGEQAVLEAQAKWTKQKKKGYVESIEDAQADKVDAVIEGGLEPMLAPNKSFPKDDELQKRIVYPCFVQPKLDGMRCIAIIEDGKCTLWSRTRKRINTVPHIVEALTKALGGHHRIVLDGELYNHEYKDRFEDLMSILRREEPDTEGEYKNAEFHVYDCPGYEPDKLPASMPPFGDMSSPFSSRNTYVDLCFTNIPKDAPVKRVVTQRARSLEELKGFYEGWLVDGYEGAMARNADAPYEAGRRSKHLQKMKEFQDGEFKIIGAEDGRGKDAGTVAKFVCVTDEGREFRPRLKATYARRRELMNDPSQWKDKLLTVTFKRWTADKMPYIPIGKSIRDYE